jgi:ParB/RepB/Spo0J family partition protein
MDDYQTVLDRTPMAAPGEAFMHDGFRPIALDLIDLDPTNIRRTPSSALKDALFRADIEARGVIQPIIVRLIDGRYRVVAGARRVKAVRELGSKFISACVRTLTDIEARAIQAAENAHREDPHPLDTWKAMVTLQAGGMSLELAGQCLGLTDRRARQLDRLGRIADPLIAAMHKHGLPNERELAMIAEAAPDTQARVFRQVTKGSGGHVGWWQIASALKSTTISQSAAIFDLEKARDIAWQEDVFAEPGSRAAFTTTNAKAFMKHQQAALEAQVAKRVKRGEAVAWVTFDDATREPAMPEAYASCYDQIPRSMKLPKNDPRCLLLAIAPNGEVKQRLVIEKGRKAQKTKAKGAAGDEARAPIAAAAARTMTAAGVAMVAAAQTAAIRRRLINDGANMQVYDLLRMLCIAVCGRNVTVNGTADRYGISSLHTHLDRLLTSEGDVAALAVEDIKQIAAETLAGMLVIAPAGNGSGPVAHSIGHHIAAGDYLEPFDSPEFLAKCSATTLKEAAEATGITGAKTASALRERLTGKIGTKWHPAEAGFEPRPADRRKPPVLDDDDEDPDADGGDGDAASEEA